MKMLSPLITLLLFFNNTFCAQASLACNREHNYETEKPSDLALNYATDTFSTVFNDNDFPDGGLQLDIAGGYGPWEEPLINAKEGIISIFCQQNKINLSNMKVKPLNEFKDLQNAAFSLNYFKNGELSQDFFNPFNHCREFFLVGCNIDTIDPEALKTLENLKSLRLCLNYLTTFDASYFLHPEKIKALSLAYNPLTELKNMDKLTSLEWLKIDPDLASNENVQEALKIWIQACPTGDPKEIVIDLNFVDKLSDRAESNLVESVRSLFSDNENISVSTFNLF